MAQDSHTEYTHEPSRHSRVQRRTQAHERSEPKSGEQSARERARERERSEAKGHTWAERASSGANEREVSP